MPRLLVILAEQRSGVTAISETLGSMPGIRNFGEIFHTAPLSHDDSALAPVYVYRAGNYHLFRLRQEQEDVGSRTNNIISQLDIFEKYINHVSQHDGDWTVATVKYNSCHCVNGAWHTPGDQPDLFHYLRSAGATVLHVNRRNKLARWLSEYRANSIGVYHYADGCSDLPPIFITLDPDEALQRIEVSERLSDTFSAFLSDYPSSLRIDYEDCLSSNCLSDTFVDAMNSVGLAIPPEARSVALRAARSSQRLIINNWDGLCERFSETRHAVWLAEIGPVPTQFVEVISSRRNVPASSWDSRLRLRG